MTVSVPSAKIALKPSFCGQGLLSAQMTTIGSTSSITSVAILKAELPMNRALPLIDFVTVRVRSQLEAIGKAAQMSAIIDPRA